MIFFITLLNLADQLSAAPAIIENGGASGVSYVPSTAKYPKDNKGSDIIWQHKPVSLDPDKYVTDGLMCWHLVFQQLLLQREHTQVQAYVTLDEGRLANGASSNRPKSEWGRVYHDVELLSIRPTYGGEGGESSSSAQRPPDADPNDKSWFEYGEPSAGSATGSSGKQVSVARNGGPARGGAEFASIRQAAHVAGYARDVALWYGYEVCLIVKPFEKNGLFLHTNILGWGGVEASPGTASS